MKSVALASLLPAAVVASAAAHTPDSVQAEAPPAAAASVRLLTGNPALVSSYRFRGIDQTFGQPAAQGDIAMASVGRTA